MADYKTIYGELRNISFDFYYKNGVLKECVCEEACVLQTGIGELIPKYDRGEVRAKNRNSLSFYKSGKLKSIYLQEQITVHMPFGACGAEFISFYEDGPVHRIFPRYGQVSGYWSEEEEMGILEKCCYELNGIKFNNKISCYCFYPSGAVKSLTLGVGEEVEMDTPAGRISARIGISFYEDGKLASLEPGRPEAVRTPIDMIIAYDNSPLGIHGDRNSMRFGRQGEILGIRTIMTGIELEDFEEGEKQKKVKRILPERKRSLIDIEQYEMVPIEISFGGNQVEILDSNGMRHTYSAKNYKIKSIYNPLYRDDAACGNCESCSGCQKTG